MDAKLKTLVKNPYIIFFPFLLFYLYIVKINKWPTLYGDEIRYVQFAKNLLHGFYSPPPPNINLWNGPGYPILLAPFVAFHIPDFYITCLNALFLYLALVLLFKAINLVAGFKIALFGCLLLAIYPNSLAVLPILYTEAFTSFLVCAFIYSLLICFQNTRPKGFVLPGIILGYLVLTKIIFGYVIVICLIIAAVFCLLKKVKTRYIKMLSILILAFSLSLPYLVYTWHLTGKMFYWGNSGGMSLYWMSSPYENEYGDWKLPELTNRQYPNLFKSAEATAILKKNHAIEMKFILSHSPIAQDSLFKQIAIRNIKQHPAKFISNYVNNMSRMLFNFPYSYAFQDAAIVRNIIIGSSILWTAIIGSILTLINWRRLIFSLKVLLLINVIYLLLTGALSAYPRQLDVMMPVFIFWMAYLAANLKKPAIRFIDQPETKSIA